MVTAPTKQAVEEFVLVSEELEGLDHVKAAASAIEWAVDRYGDDVVVASSFQDLVLVDMARTVRPDIEIIFLDTEYHFPETLAFVEHIRKIWNLNLNVARPRVPREQRVCGTEGCCEVRKVEPLVRALAGRKAWITGLKRVDTPERSEAPFVGWDERRSIVKVNPLATWTDEDVDAYVAERGLPRHPLSYVGYVSIGCAPTTKPVADGHHPREGRWPGSDKTECGLHL
jgi:phosphoadenosine phosphosulfate reductase